MAIINIEVAAATSVDTLSGTTAVGVTGGFPLSAAAYDEGDVITENFLNAGAATLNVGDEVRITTTPAQFAANGVITAIGTPTTVTSVSFRIDDVLTARSGATITNLNLNVITGRVVTPSTSAALATAESGFVHAIYEGDELASDVHQDITYTYGAVGATTTRRLLLGAPVPSGTIITNSTVSAFNILLNS